MKMKMKTHSLPSRFKLFVDCFFFPPVGRCSFKYQLNISYLPALIESLAGNHRNKILGSISALFVALSAIVSSLISAKLKYEHAGHKCNNKPLTGRRCN